MHNVSSRDSVDESRPREDCAVSLPDALPIWHRSAASAHRGDHDGARHHHDGAGRRQDRKSTCLNSSHSQISYAVFCLKKKNSMVDAGFEHQTALTKMQLDNQKEIAEIQNETQ